MQTWISQPQQTRSTNTYHVRRPYNERIVQQTSTYKNCGTIIHKRDPRIPWVILDEETGSFTIKIREQMFFFHQTSHEKDMWYQISSGSHTIDKFGLKMTEEDILGKISHEWDP
ncbi:hypothetical protein M0812_12408 [Anaeramoeba flamelloides]|uniref:Uncharacterized protein n=1 Tax=Anaeramoeba flamelloides TaxID=1746091 RepID=A0AAV7ZQN2_9EUKA|nr:hypothetical protein M0812_12408 [Anaeramoeba flamelloides]